MNPNNLYMSLLVILFSTNITADGNHSDFNCYSTDPEVGDSALWAGEAIELFSQNKFEESIEVVDACFNVFATEAVIMQKELDANKVKYPPVGRVTRNEKEKIHKLHSERSSKIHYLSQLLKAYALFDKDVEYVVQNGQVLIVDEFTGRVLPGRRFSGGLHQALEAKENVKIEKETQTLASITMQNYFRMYDKLSGMTGTADTEAAEFENIYGLGVTVIPTHRPIKRNDFNDVIYKSMQAKYKAVINEVSEYYTKGQPVLIGTISVDISELLSKMLKQKGIPHNVLNAKQHQSEAEIVAQAGLKKSITIATNMAGRGTDIKLGPGVEELGGLHIIGTARHESRRIDLQLMGRWIKGMY